MIVKIVSRIPDIIIDYIRADKKSVPYLYANLLTFDLSNENVEVLCDQEGGLINGVYLRYYDCLHFYTKHPNQYPVDSLMGMVDSLKPRVIMLQYLVGERVKDSLGLQYENEVNHIIDMDRMRQNNSILKSTLAVRDQIPEIVDLMLSTNEYRNVYNRDTLLKQMLNRYDQGVSRFYVIVESGMVVAAESTYGETNDMAILSGLVVHEDWRRQGLGQDVTTSLCNALKSEGKSMIGFLNETNEKSIALHIKLGASLYAKYAKYILRDC